MCTDPYHLQITPENTRAKILSAGLTPITAAINARREGSK